MQKVAREALKQARLAAIDAEMMQLDLRLGPSQGGRPLEARLVLMLVDKVYRRLAGRRDHGPKGDARRCAGRQPDPPAQGEDRVEHGPHPVRQGTAVAAGDRVVDAVTATEEARAVGLDFRISHCLAIDGSKMRRPNFRIARRTPPPG